MNLYKPVSDPGLLAALLLTALLLGLVLGYLVGRSRKEPATVSPALQQVETLVTAYHTAMAEMERARIAQFASLETQVGLFARAEQDLRGETGRLVGALSNSQIRGYWGEVQLHRVVEVAGMLPNVDFVEQALVPEGTKRPDMIVRLPNRRTIVVDAKAPMAAYLNQQFKEHAHQIRNHATSLSSKDYWKSFEGTAEFVVMFLPSESLLAVALEHDPELFDYCASRRIVIATPATLLALLYVVAHGWRQEAVSANTEQLAKLAVEMYERLVAMNNVVSEVGAHIKKSAEAYTSLVWNLEKRVLVSGRKMQELMNSNKTLTRHKDLPETLTIPEDSSND